MNRAWIRSSIVAACVLATASTRGDDAPSPRGLDGQPVSLKAPSGGAAAVVFCSAECPISNAYSPLLNDLAKTHPAEKLRLVGVFVDPDLTSAALAAHAKEYGLNFPVALDRRGTIARKLGATVTPEAFVIDDRGQVRYQGRIDDQFAARGVRNAHSESRELRDAVASVIAGKPVADAFVKPIGCPLPEPPKGADVAPTYAKDVAPILQKHCQDCHRPGQVGPFSLLTYDQARKRADDLASVAEDRRMPPWKAVAGYGPGFDHDRSMTAREIATLAAWAEAGAPKGEDADMPPAREFSSDWELGQPDLILEIPEPFNVPAEVRGPDGKPADIYRCFVIPTDLPEDVYITGIEYRPGNPRVVHHILGYVDTTGEARKKDAADPAPGYECFGGPQIRISNDLSGWAPGAAPAFLPDGIGRKLPRKADVVLQVHYHPTGKAESDRTRVGLFFARKPIRQTLHWGAALNTRFVLKPGVADQEVNAAWKIPTDVQAVAVSPHMHLLGRSMEMWAELPGGKRLDLVKIDDWDFKWQLQYYFKEPIDLPRDTVVKVKAVFDNSSANPYNPDPNREVRWGEATTDEMCIGFLATVKKGQDLTKPGEMDDLPQIFEEQFREARRRAAEAEKKARSNP
ncbi:MAG: redoxin domain-containing protein [Isosphaeraceae bacterium]